jgi:hypothetical protein
MPKTKSGKGTTSTKLGKVGKKAGAELSESQLAQASGGASPQLRPKSSLPGD